MSIEVSGVVLGGPRKGVSADLFLSDLQDVSIGSGLGDGQVLRYNIATNLWENANIEQDIANVLERNFVGTNGVDITRYGNVTHASLSLTAAGDIVPTSVVDGALDVRLPSINSTHGTYGGSSQVPVITVDDKGRVINVTTIPIYSSGGTITSIGLTGGDTGLTVSGSPVTTSGTMTIGGILRTSAGGTGVATLTGYVRGNGTSPFTAINKIPGADITGDITGGSGSAAKLSTSRSLTVGQLTRAFDGTQDLVWDLPAIGAVDISGDKMQGPIDLADIALITASTTIPLASVTSNILRVASGTGNINSFGSAAPGVWRRIIFDTEVTIIHTGAGIRLPGGNDLHTEPGDIADFLCTGGAVWLCTGVLTASGAPIREIPTQIIRTSTVARFGVHYVMAAPDITLTLPLPGQTAGRRIRISNASGGRSVYVDFLSGNYRSRLPGIMTLDQYSADLELTDTGDIAVGWV